MINIKENEDLSKLNHSCAHLLAQAVKHLYPNAKFWVGPVIEEGFYYDIDLGNEVIKEEDLPKIEKEMKKLSKDGKRIVRHEISKDEALEMFHDDPYKIDLISRMDENEQVISCYTQGDFTAYAATNAAMSRHLSDCPLHQHPLTLPPLPVGAGHARPARFPPPPVTALHIPSHPTP